MVWWHGRPEEISLYNSWQLSQKLAFYLHWHGLWSRVSYIWVTFPDHVLWDSTKLLHNLQGQCDLSSIKCTQTYTMCGDENLNLVPTRELTPFQFWPQAESLCLWNVSKLVLEACHTSNTKWEFIGSRDFGDIWVYKLQRNWLKLFCVNVFLIVSHKKLKGFGHPDIFLIYNHWHQNCNVIFNLKQSILSQLSSWKVWLTLIDCK